MQERFLSLVPLPHVVLQGDHSDQPFHSPSTANSVRKVTNDIIMAMVMMHACMHDDDNDDDDDVIKPPFQKHLSSSDKHLGDIVKNGVENGTSSDHAHIVSDHAHTPIDHALYDITLEEELRSMLDTEIMSTTPEGNFKGTNCYFKAT